jgi:hypothetical protein
MMKTLGTGIVIAAIAWIVLFVIIGIPIWIAFIVAAAIIRASIVGGGGRRAVSG